MSIETQDILEMCKSLVCILESATNEQVTKILLGEGYSIEDIHEFIEYCEK